MCGKRSRPTIFPRLSNSLKIPKSKILNGLLDCPKISCNYWCRAPMGRRNTHLKITILIYCSFSTLLYVQIKITRIHKLYGLCTFLWNAYQNKLLLVLRSVLDKYLKVLGPRTASMQVVYISTFIFWGKVGHLSWKIIGCHHISINGMK